MIQHIYQSFPSLISLPILVYITVNFSTYVTGSPHIQAFGSHVSIATPAHTVSHGVGHLIPQLNLYERANHRPYNHINSYSYKGNTAHGGSLNFNGYPKERPAIPFHYGPPPVSSFSSTTFYPGIQTYKYDYRGTPVLPPSPYQSNSPNPESLWPEGLYIPASLPTTIVGPEALHNGQISIHRISAKQDEDFSSLIEADPYYLDGADAYHALAKIFEHGELYYNEIPHVKALLANQQRRIANGLQGNRLGSLRPTSPFYRLQT